MIKLFEIFAGIGAQRRALENLYPGKVKSIGLCEWNLIAILAYFSIHERTNDILGGGVESSLF